MMEEPFTPDNYSLSEQSYQAQLTNINVAGAVVHSVFILITLMTLILCSVWNLLQLRLQQNYSQSLKYCNEARTLFSLALMIIYVFVETEAVLASVKGSIWKAEAHVANCLAMCGTVSCLLSCALLLDVLSVIFHFLLFIYWIFCATLEMFHMMYYLEETLPHVGSNDVRILFSCCLLLLYICLVTLEAVVLFRKVSGTFHFRGIIYCKHTSAVY